MVRALLILLFVAGCAPRDVLVPLPADQTASETLTVFTATNRAGVDGRPTDRRAPDISFAELQISVPPNRVPGDISTPRNRKPEAKLDYLLSDVQALGGEAGFVRALSEDLRARPPSRRNVVLYVHGFNITFSQGTLRLAQITKDLGLDAVPVHFAWPSTAHPLAYERDRGSALYSRDALERLIGLTRRAGANRVIIVAHSMGAFLTMETLRQMEIARPGSVARDIHGVVLVSPDIDVDVFKSQAARIRKLPSIFAIFVARNDQALRLSAQLTGEEDRLGNLRDASEIADLDVTLIDVTEFNDGEAGHFLPGTSPDLIAILSGASQVQGAFADDPSAGSGLLPGTVLTIRNVTEVILVP